MPHDEATSFLDGDPVRLRQWNTDIIHRLPEPPWDSATVGSGDTAAIRLRDHTGGVAAEHAVIERFAHGWVMREIGGEIRAAGARRGVVLLVPGLEVSIGGLTLVAEGRQWVSLRSLVARLVGWDSPAIDASMRALRLGAERVAPLVMCGPGNMIALARPLHQRALGADAPFVVCDPRRNEVRGDVRSPRNYFSGMAALRPNAKGVVPAAGGSICVWSRRLPSDFDDVRATLRDPSTRVQLIVCSEERTDKPYHVDPIVIPPLSERGHDDIVRIIDECTDDAMLELESTESLGKVDREWVLRNDSGTIPDIDRAVRRLIAMRDNDGVCYAAARALGMTPASLAGWFDRLGDHPSVRRGALAAGRT